MLNYVATKNAVKSIDELVKPPEQLSIHESLLTAYSAEEITRAFRAVRTFFYDLLTDIAKDPVSFGFSALTVEQKRGGSEDNGCTWAIETEASGACRLPFYLMMYLFSHGRIDGEKYIVDVPRFRQANKGVKTVKRCENILKAFAGYGFVFDGLKNYKIPNNAGTFSIEFPDMPAVLAVLHHAAKKCYPNKGFDYFIRWNPRLMAQARYEWIFEGYELMTDSLHGEADREFVIRFHEALTEKGYFCRENRYFENEKQETYLFALESESGRHPNLSLRIRDVTACLEYIEQCPESVKELFRKNRRSRDSIGRDYCSKSVVYIFEGVEKWCCACWGAAFGGIPLIIENIPHYIRLVELGKKQPKRVAGSGPHRWCGI
jgi:hypothetical protein